MPAIMPATETGWRNRPSSSRIAGAICTITRAIAPTPTPKSSAARLGSKAAAPIQAPKAAGGHPLRKEVAMGRFWHI
jgi:hypothetical protein